MESTSLTKALWLLEATAGHPEGRSLAELAAEAGLAKPKAHRLLIVLTGLGYLARPAAGVYRQRTAAKRLVSDAPTRRLEAPGSKTQQRSRQARNCISCVGIGHAAVFLASHEADYGTGSVLRVDGGYWLRNAGF